MEYGNASSSMETQPGSPREAEDLEVVGSPITISDDDEGVDVCDWEWPIVISDEELCQDDET